ncbi:response regulator [Marinilongibacter aquaticus]|uniref:hybrid sensor histidine kinase/response regulator transcription factor n=1 Tax=Marinilongibacter aquaticus TaxID=2975157 RepID=UPI0021BD2DAF|nr:hybrid sensor histidine kinase/response regulator transcription factor [Marinilongibacter aquaticus]UBM59143.1 response regulator [Marinilongibacter aquaticus]
MKLRYLKIYLWFALFCIQNLAFAQTGDHANLITEEEDWLPRRSINCIFQDSRGLLWIGAISGLYRYDGYEVLHFTTQPNNEHAIFTNTVTSIAELKNGNLLIGTESGLSLFDIKTHYFETISPRIEAYSDFAQDTDGNTWIAVGNNALLYQLKSDYRLPLKLKPRLKNADEIFKKTGVIRAVSPLALHSLLIGSNRGLFILSTETGKLQSTSIQAPVTIIKKSNEGEIMVGTANQGLFELTFEKQKMQIRNQYHLGAPNQAAYDHVSAISFGKNGECMVSTLQNVYLSSKNRGKRAFSEYKGLNTLLQDNNILTTYIDELGIMWLGTLKGLYKIRPKAINVERFRISTPTYTPTNQAIQYIFRDFSNTLWLKTRNDGIFTFNPETQKFSKNNLPSNINSFYQSVGGTLYFCTSDGLFQKTEKGFTQIYASKSSTAFGLEMEKGEWLLGCSLNGLEYYSSNNSQLYTKLVAEANTLFHLHSGVYVMIKDHAQNIWIGSRGDGLMRISLSDGKIKKYSGINLKEGTISRRILCLYEDSKGRIWIGSRTGGLYRYNPETDDFTQFTVKHGLPSDVICGIAEDKHNEIIISTNNGLALYIPNEPIPFQSFGIDDGIDFTDFSFNAVAKGADGEVYFGNTNGLYKVNPIPKLKRGKTNFFWNSLHVLGKNSPVVRRIGEDQKVTLKADENSFEVKFSFTDLSNPSKNRFAYRLMGSRSNEWIYDNTSVQKIQLLSIPPGNYVLELKTANSYGQWSDDVMKLNISISPPFYLSSTARVLYFLLGLLLIFILYVAFKRWRELNKNLEQEKAYGALKDQQMVFFSDLSHELKNRLTMILGPLENALSGKKVNQAVLANLYEQAQRLKRITDQIMNIRKNEGGEFILKVSEGNLYEKLISICRDTEPLALIRDVTLEYHFDKTLDPVWFDDELVEIMLLNLLNNAIKFNRPKGSVIVRGKKVFLQQSDLPETSPQTGHYFQCEVEDTGVGIPENEIKYLVERFYRASNTAATKEGSGIGLELVTRLIQKHKGFIDIHSELDKGTQITFYIPLEKKHFHVSELKVSVNNVSIIEIIPEEKPVQKPSILIADDDPEIISLLDETLSDDFIVTAASNGQEALGLISKNDFDLVISDLSMPKLDGLALLRNLKENPQWNHIPFIILTARNSEFHKLVCIQSEVDDFIDKPFSPKLIKWRAKSLINNRNRLEEKFSKKINVNPDESLITSPEEEFMQKVVGIIETHISDDKLSVEFLAEECSMSRATFYRKIESILGESPSDFIRTYRLKKATQLLKNTNLYISEIAYQTGFKNPKYFTRIFQREFGATPTEYIQNVKNEP